MTNKVLVIGMDLDAVVFDYDTWFRTKLAELLNLRVEDFPKSNSYSYVGVGLPIRDEAHFIELHGRAVVEKGLYRHMPLLPGAAHGMRALSKAGSRLKIITHRLCAPGTFARAAADTAAALDDAAIRFDDLCLLGPGGPGGKEAGSKANVAADINVDDAPHVVEALRAPAVGRRVVVVDQPYNRHLGDEDRVHGWTELLATLLPLCPDPQAGIAELEKLGYPELDKLRALLAA